LFHWFFVFLLLLLLFFAILFIWAFIFAIYLLLPVLGLACSYFSRSLRCSIRFLRYFEIFLCF
jgi:hypothetical protein